MFYNFKKFESPLSHINGVKCTWCIKIYISYNTKKWSIFKDKTSNLQGIYTF
jgi:hypothetical protein